jgi:hypothetical protein
MSANSAKFRIQTTLEWMEWARRTKVIRKPKKRKRQPPWIPQED